MIKEYAAIFDRKQCNYVAAGMIKKQEANATVKDVTPYSHGAYGFYDLPEALHLVPYLTKIIERDYGGVVFKNAYTRIYVNGNQLKIHTDRVGLDITISICVYSDVGFDWPMSISNVAIDGLWRDNLPVDEYKKDSRKYITKLGDGIVCLGTKNPHWRETLECPPDKKIIQTFYHWAWK